MGACSSSPRECISTFRYYTGLVLQGLTVSLASVRAPALSSASTVARSRAQDRTVFPLCDNEFSFEGSCALQGARGEERASIAGARWIEAQEREARAVDGQGQQ